MRSAERRVVRAETTRFDVNDEIATCEVGVTVGESVVGTKARVMVAEERMTR